TGLPIRGRSYSETLTLAPGVTDIDGDGNPNVKGAREVDFQLRLSGVPINNPFSADRALDLNIEAFEEIQIITGALTAEYSSQGGLGLVTTRSGGNEFQGSFKIFYQSSSIDSDGAANRDVTNDVREIPSFRTLRPFITVGGAIKKDRLWYFATLEYIDEQEPINFLAASKLSGKEGHRDFFKLTWQVNPEHKASLEFFYEPTETFGNFIGPTIADETDALTEDVGRLFNVRETWVMSPAVFLDSLVSYFTFDRDLMPTFTPEFDTADDINLYGNPVMFDEQMLDFVERTGLSVNPVSEHYIFDLSDRTVRGPFNLTQIQNSDQFQIREDLSIYVDDFFGNHTIKTGFEFIDVDYSEDTTFRPTVLQTVARGIPAIFNFQAPVPNGQKDAEADRYNLAFYVQDVWKPIPNLAVRVGVRVDREVIHAPGRTVFDPLEELSEYNRVARLFYETPTAVGNVDAARGQFVRAGEGGLNFEINPLTDTFYCDLDGDGTCNGQTEPGGSADLSIPGNSDSAILKSIFSRNNFDCSRTSNWGASPGDMSGSGIVCSASVAGGVREGTDIDPEDISIGNTNVAPRFSISYDPFADGKTKLYGTWGRVYGELFLNTVVREQRADTQSYTSLQRDETVQILRDVTEGAFTMYQVDRDLRTPYTDEWTIGFERELAPELAVKVVYTQRKGKQQLQDIDVNHTPVDRRGGDGTSDVFSGDGIFDDCVDGFNAITITCTPDGQPDLEVINPNFNQIFYLSNFNESEYRGLEIVLSKRLHRNWLFEASYTWSEAEGNAEAFLSLLGDDPSQVDLEDGFLNYDQRHIFKFFAVAHLPKEFSVGGAITYASGLPFSVINRDFVVDDLGNATFRTVFPTAQRNDQRNRDYWTFDFNLKKSFTIGGRVRATASFDVFDLLNTDDLRIFSVNRAAPNGLEIFDPGQPATREFGRRFQFGLEFYF
ncbi:MAG: TonB-dependent receptor domain-containing protein, partial [Rhodothermales bacterium]